jgi:hypothetical protein
MIYLFEQYFRSPLFLNNDNNPLHESEFMIFETKNDHIIDEKDAFKNYYKLYKIKKYNI